MITLTRFCYAPHAVFGQMDVAGTKVFSVEKPWRDNERFKSCIPEDTYRCRWLPTTTSVPSVFGGHTWYVEGGTVGYDSGDRTRVAWHVGNTADDVVGCLAFGLRLGTVSGAWAVQRSRDALVFLRDNLPDEFDFEVKWGMAV